jgi:hypothetical protein
MCIENKVITGNREIADAFNSYFSSIQARTDSDVANANSSSLSKLKEFVEKSNNPNLFSIPLINTEFVCKQLQCLKVKKAKGPDDIGPYFLKIAAEIIAPSLCHIFNVSIISGMFPSRWKEAKVTPIYKKGKKHCVENYRPISILCTLSKILERYIHEKLYDYLTNAKLLLPQQSGFRAQHSCATSLTHMVDSWLGSLNNGKMVGALFIDLQKAFDSIDHSILLEKLHIYGCDKNSINWFTSYLSNRNQKVNFMNVCSSLKATEKGVPQGSILGPLLFIIFINDLPLHLSHCDSDLYADDTTIFTEGNNLKDIEILLNKDAENVYKWCTENNLSINAKKTTCMLIATPQKVRTIKESLKVYINNVQIPVSSCEKVLGVHISNSLNWDKHVTNVKNSMKGKLYILRRIRSYLSVHARKIFCNSYMFPYLNYCSTIWGNTTKGNLTKLHRLQKRAARLIYNDPISSSADLFKKLKWMPMEKLIEYEKLVLVYKSLNMKCPQYMHDMLSYQSNERYSMRSTTQRKLVVPKVNVEMFRKSFVYSGSHLWNQLPHHIQQADSLRKFKQSCLSYLQM